MPNWPDIIKSFAEFDLWPCSALDKKKELVTVTPCREGDLGALGEMYNTYEPKAAIQGLPPVDRNTRSEWIAVSLKSALNIKAEVAGQVVAHGMLFPMPDPDVAEFTLFVHNQVQNGGIGSIVAYPLFAAAKRLGYKKVWVFESRNNARALRIYYKVGFREARREGNELELELDLACVAESPDLSDIVTPVIISTGIVKPPDYRAVQDAAPDTQSVILFSPGSRNSRLRKIIPS